MEKYHVVKELGSGSFGRVVKVYAKQQPEVPLAIKIIKMANLSEKEKDSALNEIRLLASIHSPNVIAYHDAFFDNINNTLNIVMEFADGGDLEVHQFLLRESSNAKEKRGNALTKILFGKWPTIYLKL